MKTMLITGAVLLLSWDCQKAVITMPAVAKVGDTINTNTTGGSYCWVGGGTYQWTGSNAGKINNPKMEVMELPFMLYLNMSDSAGCKTNAEITGNGDGSNTISYK